MKDNLDINESELVSLLAEDEENVKNIIYDKYGYIIDILVHKYNNVIKILQIDEEEVRCEASYGFSDGINSYNDEKSASLATFLTLCIERRITKYLNKFTTKKAKFLNETFSLDYVNRNKDTTLIESISDDNKFNPLNNLTEIETFDEILSLAKENLSLFEFTVFTYMLNDITYQNIAKSLEKTPKQIDNTIQRIKLKMRKLIEEL